MAFGTQASPCRKGCLSRWPTGCSSRGSDWTSVTQIGQLGYTTRLFALVSGTLGTQLLPACALALPQASSTLFRSLGTPLRSLCVLCCVGAPVVAVLGHESSGQWPNSCSDHISNPGDWSIPKKSRPLVFVLECLLSISLNHFSSWGAGISGVSLRPQSPVVGKTRSPSYILTEQTCHSRLKVKQRRESRCLLLRHIS